ncbi:MAG: cation:proton antiporter [Candidatus Methanoperedens sp.]|nr:cation:proton antiporter [Candidatus Methanoperedens sp.]
MNELTFLKDFVIIFGAAIGINFLFHRLRIAPIVGYLIAGVLLGPSVLGVTKDIALIEILAELGVILLLFLIGIEFSLSELVRISRAVFVGGFLQVFLTTGAVLLVSLLAGISLQKGIFIGILVAMSSTAIVFKVLSDRGEMDSPQGRLTSGILIFQDLSIVGVVLFLPMLGGESSFSALDMAFKVFWALSIVVLTIVASRFIVPKMLHQVVSIHSRELFLISIVLICFGTAWLTSLVGLSLALGAFLAGLVISESQYGHQAFSEILPLKDIFSILFFVSIGMLLDVNSMLNNPLIVLLAVVLVLVIKFAAGSIVTIVLGYPLRIGVLVGVVLAQIGEFSFVLSKEGINLGLFSESDYQVFLASSIITMIFTPFMIQGSARFAESFEKLPISNKVKSGSFHEDIIEKHELKNHVIVVGFGLNGRNVTKVLSASAIPFIVLEMNPETVRVEKKRGLPISYGDASKEAILTHLGIKAARCLVIAISDASATRRIVELSRNLNKNIYIIARTRYTSEVKPLYSLGANDVIPEEFETSIEIISRVLHNFFIPVNEIEKHISEIRKGGYEIFRNVAQKYDVFPELKQHLPDIEIETIRVEATSPLAGRSLANIGFRKKYGVTVLAIRRGEKTITNPSGETQLDVQDIVILLGTRESIVGVMGVVMAGGGE